MFSLSLFAMQGKEIMFVMKVFYFQKKVNEKKIKQSWVFFFFFGEWKFFFFWCRFSTKQIFFFLLYSCYLSVFHHSIPLALSSNFAFCRWNVDKNQNEILCKKKKKKKNPRNKMKTMNTQGSQWKYPPKYRGNFFFF